MTDFLRIAGRRPLADLRATGAMLRSFGPASWAAAIAAAGLAAVVLGVPTRLIANSWFIRMTPTRPQDYVLWVMSAALVGLIAGSYTLGRSVSHEYKVMSGGIVSYLAVGCPICNKLVVLALGVSGAMTYFAPAQLFIGLGSLALLAWTVLLRARALSEGCALPAMPGIQFAPLPAAGAGTFILTDQSAAPRNGGAHSPDSSAGR